MMQVAPLKTQSASRAARLRFALQMAEQANRIGERIRQEREGRGWSRPEMARQLPGVVSGNDIYRWENGKHTPREDSLESIAQLFGLDVADLYAGPLSEREEPEDNDLMGKLREKSAPDQLNRIENSLEDLATGQAELHEKLDELLAAQAHGSKRKEADE